MSALRVFDAFLHGFCYSIAGVQVLLLMDFLSRKTRILVRGSSHFLCGNVPFWEVFPVCTHHFWHSMDFFSRTCLRTKNFSKTRFLPLSWIMELNHCRITTDASSWPKSSLMIFWWAIKSVAHLNSLSKIFFESILCSSLHTLFNSLAWYLHNKNNFFRKRRHEVVFCYLELVIVMISHWIDFMLSNSLLMTRKRCIWVFWWWLCSSWKRGGIRRAPIIIIIIVSIPHYHDTRGSEDHEGGIDDGLVNELRLRPK